MGSIRRNSVLDRLDVVAVGVEHVGAVVAFVVLGSKPRRAVIGPSCLQRRDVEPGDGPLACVDDEPPALPASEGYEALVLELQVEPQGSQGRLVEPPAGQQVPHPQGDFRPLCPRPFSTRCSTRWKRWMRQKSLGVSPTRMKRLWLRPDHRATSETFSRWGPLSNRPSAKATAGWRPGSLVVRARRVCLRTLNFASAVAASSKRSRSFAALAPTTTRGGRGRPATPRQVRGTGRRHPA